MRTGFFSHLPECAPVVRMALMCAFAAAAIVLPQQGEATDQVVLKSSAFESNGPIPTKYTCEGEDVSPALTWSGVPSGTKSLALIVDDPDAPDPAAPKMTWVHWVLYDVPPSAQGLPEAAGVNSLPRGTREGLNDWKRKGYGGPCPPIGRHRYFFKLYALDTDLGDLGEPTKARLKKAMAGHILGEVQLVGTYQKSGK
jgi:Raf kinase inhibitor-like YbhB/YbcL family protein